MKKMIDPPSGWRYGFPKEIPENVNISDEKDLKKWLVENGYPQSEIYNYGDFFHCRYWNMPDETTDKTNTQILF